MEWNTLQEPVESYEGKYSVGEIATIEALRAIAEQLEKHNTLLEELVHCALAYFPYEEDRGTIHGESTEPDA